MSPSLSLFYFFFFWLNFHLLIWKLLQYEVEEGEGMGSNLNRWLRSFSLFILVRFFFLSLFFWDNKIGNGGRLSGHPSPYPPRVSHFFHFCLFKYFLFRFYCFLKQQDRKKIWFTILSLHLFNSVFDIY